MSCKPYIVHGTIMVKYKNLIATTLLGPLLILNPEFSLQQNILP